MSFNTAPSIVPCLIHPQTRVASAQRDRAEQLERRQQHLHQAHERKRTEHSQILLRAELQREVCGLEGCDSNVSTMSHVGVIMFQ